MALIVTTIPASPVRLDYVTLRGHSDINPYIKFWEWQVLKPVELPKEHRYNYAGYGPYHEWTIYPWSYSGLWPNKKVIFRFGGREYRGPVYWGSWLTFYTYNKKYFFQAWGVDKHEVEYYGEIKSFERPLGN